MMIPSVSSPEILASTSPASPVDSTAPTGAEATTMPEATSQTTAADPATAKAEVELRFVLEFGVRLSVQASADTDGAVETDAEDPAVQAYEDQPEGSDRATRLARSMTHALDRALHHGLRALFTGHGDKSLSVEERQQLKALEHELRHSLKDAFRGNQADGGVDLQGYATETLAAVQDFAQGFGDLFAAGTDGAAEDATTADATATDLPEAGVDTADTVPAAADGSELRVRDGHQRRHDHGLHFRRHDRARFTDSQDPFGRVSGLLERITAQLQDLVDSLQPAGTEGDAQGDTGTVVDPTTTGGKAELQVSGEFSLNGSISLVA